MDADPSPKDVPESEILQEILEKRTAYSGTLYSLSDLRTFRSWDFSWPTITKPRRFTSRHSYASDEAFFNTIENHNNGVSYGLLQAVGAFEENNSVVLYGGALVDIVTKREAEIKDWDLRLIGEECVKSTELCVEAAKKFVADVFTWLKMENEKVQIRNQERKNSAEGSTLEEALFDIQQVMTIRSKSTVTIVIPGKKVPNGNYHRVLDRTMLQFTFAPYETVQDLFANCTPHCTQLAIKNTTVVLSEAAKYCLESLCVVLNAKVFKQGDSARSIRAEMKRACEYFDDKGFDIILPQLDIPKLPDRNLKFHLQEALDLPDMTVIYRKVEGYKIMADRVYVPEDDSNTEASDDDDSDYDGDVAGYSVGESIHHNIRCLVSDVYDRFQFVAEGEVTDPVFDFAPLLTSRMVDKTYETVKLSLASGTIVVDKVIQYFQATPPAQVFEKLLVSRINETATKTGALPASFKLDMDVLDELILKEKKAILLKLKTIQSKMEEKGLDRLLSDSAEPDFPSDADILKALYGDYLLSED